MAGQSIQQGSVTVDGFELGYSIEGSGPNALVIGSAVYYPRTFSAHLREHLRLIFVDHRGFGKAIAPYSNASFELNVLIDDIEMARQALGLDKVIIVGHSGHAYLALEYAKAYPQHVSHVVLLAISPDSTVESFAAADQYLEESVDPERKAALADSLSHLAADLQADPKRGFIHRSIRSGPRIWYDYTYDARHLWAGVETNTEMFDYVWGKLFRELDITVGLEDLKLPVLLGLGRYDYWNPPHLWNVVREKFHDLRIRVFEKSGHTPQLEQPDDFDRELLAWLEEKQD
jgi:proline iminopeptidase